MKMMHGNTGVEEREQWRARIMRALAELRNEDNVADGRMRRDDAGDESGSDDNKL